MSTFRHLTHQFNLMIAILLFFSLHWFFSLFFHSFFLHRYASHKMYTTSKGWEKTFYLLTWFFQGSSYLVPRAYAVMHRMHHTYSDTEQDPHSPHFVKDVIGMMRHTIIIFRSFQTKKDRKSTRLNSSHIQKSRMPSSA